jgi:cytochrome c peroxidase
MRYSQNRLALVTLLAIGLLLLPVGCKPADKPKASKSTASSTDETTDSSDDASGTSEPLVKQIATAPDKSAAASSPSDSSSSDSKSNTAASNDSSAGGKLAQSGKVMLGDSELFAGIPGQGSLSVEEISQWLADPANHEPLEVELPLGLSAGAAQIKGLDKNPLTRAKIELGRQLYFDGRLSADEKISCATCHNPDTGFTANTQFGVGIRKQLGGRNSPVAYNRILSDAQFWDGRAPSLEDQAVGPIANAIEMGNTHDACVACLAGIEGYKLQFEKVFGELTIEKVGAALASFERAIVTGPSPFDYHVQWEAASKQDPDDLEDVALEKYNSAKKAAEEHPMSESAVRGFKLFFSEKANCTACHVGANLSDEKYHNLGIGMMAAKPDIGRAEVTKDEKDTGAFKTPTIRNVALSAPYMHDGSIKTLDEVVEWYAKGGHPNPHLSDKIKKLDLTEQDKKDLVEFMNACTGDFPKIERGRLPK